jgi:BirA family transcriptional regulator, biotin operon repressor / biotin---[acetyl-CoA-carboxylase] ligase
MNEHEIRKTLSDLSLGGLRFFEQTGSTNDVALAWAADGAPDLSLVYAEEQTAGRGRSSRQWLTPSASALAFSLVLRPRAGEETSLQMFTALGALAVCETLGGLGMEAQIKWPNDVLLNGRKVCGVLAEAVWLGEEIDSIVLGIGVNVKREAVPMAETLNFPATSLEAEAGRSFDRSGILREVLLALFYWRSMMTKDLFLKKWDERLAFRGQQVEVRDGTGRILAGKLDGLEPDGSLRLISSQGQAFSVAFGEVHLRPVV